MRCDSHLTREVVSWVKEYGLVFIALNVFLNSDSVIIAEKHTLIILDAQLLLCQGLVIHLFLGHEPRLYSTLPHTSYKDFVSFCGAAQSGVLQNCRLLCLRLEIPCSFRVLSRRVFVR